MTRSTTKPPSFSLITSKWLNRKPKYFNMALVDDSYDLNIDILKVHNPINSLSGLFVCLIPFHVAVRQK